MVHNHELLLEDEVHKLRSHKKVEKAHVDYFQKMRRNGMKVLHAYRLLRNEAGGSPSLGFSERDAYNSVANEVKRTLDGGDANHLMCVLEARCGNEQDFFYKFKLDADDYLTCFFWRDTQMKCDYMLFGDLVVFDTTYRTNRYEMICAPFVCMNHHAKNVMVGCGFLMNEKIESFVWLFETFFEAMGNVQLKTMMTDQAFSMGSAIEKVFPLAKHRLCTWHILENSKKNIDHLRVLGGFVDKFDYVLMRCDTEAEFNFCW